MCQLTVILSYYKYNNTSIEKQVLISFVLLSIWTLFVRSCLMYSFIWISVSWCFVVCVFSLSLRMDHIFGPCGLMNVITIVTILEIDSNRHMLMVFFGCNFLSISFSESVMCCVRAQLIYFFFFWWRCCKQIFTDLYARKIIGYHK